MPKRNGTRDHRRKRRLPGAFADGAKTRPSRRRLHAWLAALRTRLANLRALWRDFTGESAYEKYVERHRREHPDHAPMGEREFWRARARFQEDNVSTGCC